MFICAKISNFQLDSVVCRLYNRLILKIYFFCKQNFNCLQNNQIFNWVALYAGYTLESPIYSNYRTATLSGFYVPGFNIIKGPKYCQCHKQLMKTLY